MNRHHSHNSLFRILGLLCVLSGTTSSLANAQISDATPSEIRLESGAIVKIWPSGKADQREDFIYQFIETDGSTSSPSYQDTEIHLKSTRFDPLQESVSTNFNLQANIDSNLWIVQFHTNPRGEYRHALERLGAKIMPGHIHGQAWIVRMPKEVQARVIEQAWVRWMGQVSPEMKLDPEIKLQELNDEKSIDVQIRIEPPNQHAQARLYDLVLENGGTILSVKKSGTSIVCSVNRTQLVSALKSDDCYFASKYEETVDSSADSRITSKAVFTSSTIGPYMGEGVRIATNDANYHTDSELMIGNINHPGLVNQPILRYNPPISPPLAFNNRHGVSTYSMLYAPTDHPDFPEVQGTVSLGQGIFNSRTAFRTTGLHALSLDRDCVTLPLTTTVIDPVLYPPASAHYRAVAESNSWNTGVSLVYGSDATETDSIAFHYQHTITHGTGNSPGGIGDESIAKNIITAGALDINGDPSDPSVHSSSPSQGNGPVDIDPLTLQGRVKPDLIQPSLSVWVAGNGTLDPGSLITEHTRLATGVSFSTPSIAGMAGLVYEMWGKEYSSGSGKNAFRRTITSTTGIPDTDVYANRPAPSVVKALLINTADPYDWNQDTDNDGYIDSPTITPNNSLNRGEQGWGRPDIQELDTRTIWYQDSNFATVQCLYSAPGSISPVMFINPELNSLDTVGQTYSRCFEVTPTDTELRVTLVWSDPPPSLLSGGNPLVNNLDLEVIAPDGTTTYLGNYGLIEDGDITTNHGIWSVAGGTPDVMNNVENVFIPSDDLQTGLYVVKVKLTTLNADGNMPAWTKCSPNTPPVQSPDMVDDSKFALVISRGPCTADFNQDGTVDIDDVYAHAAAISSGNPRADVNYDGTTNFFDLGAFSSIYAAGCP